MREDFTYVNSAGHELRVMWLPDRKCMYLVLVGEHGMTCVARTLGDPEAERIVAWLDGFGTHA
jgi:hypothetical protein